MISTLITYSVVSNTEETKRILNLTCTINAHLGEDSKHFKVGIHTTNTQQSILRTIKIPSYDTNLCYTGWLKMNEGVLIRYNFLFKT